MEGLTRGLLVFLDKYLNLNNNLELKCYFFLLDFNIKDWKHHDTYESHHRLI